MSSTTPETFAISPGARGLLERLQSKIVAENFSCAKLEHADVAGPLRGAHLQGEKLVFVYAPDGWYFIDRAATATALEQRPRFLAGIRSRRSPLAGRLLLC